MDEQVAQVEALLAQALETAEDAGDKLDYAVNEVRRTFGIPCKYEHCGGYDSPGYDIDCYAIAYVTKAGSLGIYPYTHEVY